MTSASENSWIRYRPAGRAYWLPPGGIGNGLDAPAWAPLIDADASEMMLLLDTLREAGIPGYAARLDRLGRRAPAYRIGVGTRDRPRAEDATRDLIIGRRSRPRRQGRG